MGVRVLEVHILEWLEGFEEEVFFWKKGFVFLLGANFSVTKRN